MANLYERKDSPYWWNNDNGRCFSTKIPKQGATAEATRELRKQAEIIADALRVKYQRIQSGLDQAPPPETVTFAAYTTWWTTHKLPKKKSPDKDRWRLNNLVPFFGPHRLDAITPQLVDEYVTLRSATPVGKPPRCPATRPKHPRAVLTPKGTLQCPVCKVRVIDARRLVCNNTINREVDQLKVMLRDATGRDLVVSPLKGTKKLEVVETLEETRVLTLDEIGAIASTIAIKSRSRAVLWRLSAETLIRFGNAINLQRAENKGTHLALTDSKTGPYKVTLSPSLQQALQSLPMRGKYYFADLRKTKAAGWAGDMRRVLKQACKKLGIPYGRHSGGITFHTGTRASGATLQLQRGADLETVRENGNWKGYRTLVKYLHSNMDRRRAVTDALSAAIDAAMTANQT